MPEKDLLIQIKKEINNFFIFFIVILFDMHDNSTLWRKINIISCYQPYLTNELKEIENEARIKFDIQKLFFSFS